MVWRRPLVLGHYRHLSHVFPRFPPILQAFKAAWEEKYPGKKTPIFGEYNYDMVKLAALALKDAGSADADAVKASLMKVSQGYMGTTGDKSFDEKGDVGATYGRWTVKDGAITDYR